MAHVGEHYQKHIGELTSKRATWEPGDQLALGDVGVETKGLFRFETSLAKLGIEWAPVEGVAVPKESKSSVKWRSLGGHAGVDGEPVRVELELEFERAGTVVFEARNIRHYKIDDLRVVSNAITELGDKWDRYWMLIDQIWIAERAAVMVAATDGAKAGIVGELPNLRTFVDASTEVSVEVRNGQITKFEHLQNVPLLYTCRRLNWRRKLQPVAGGNSQPEPVDLTEVAWADILMSWD